MFCWFLFCVFFTQLFFMLLLVFCFCFTCSQFGLFFSQQKKTYTHIRMWACVGMRVYANIWMCLYPFDSVYSPIFHRCRVVLCCAVFVVVISFSNQLGTLPSENLHSLDFVVSVYNSYHFNIYVVRLLLHFVSFRSVFFFFYSLLLLWLLLLCLWQSDCW